LSCVAAPALLGPRASQPLNRLEKRSTIETHLISIDQTPSSSTLRSPTGIDACHSFRKPSRMGTEPRCVQRQFGLCASRRMKYSSKASRPRRYKRRSNRVAGSRSTPAATRLQTHGHALHRGPEILTSQGQSGSSSLRSAIISGKQSPLFIEGRRVVLITGTTDFRHSHLQACTLPFSARVRLECVRCG